jgi:hypothetical protein
MRLRQLFEEGTAGGTVSGSIAALPNPQVAIGNASARKAYGRGANPKPPKAKQRLNPNRTAKNALDIDTNIFGGEAIKR